MKFISYFPKEAEYLYKILICGNERVVNFFKDLNSIRQGKCPRIHGLGPILFGDKKEDRDDLLPDGFSWMLGNLNYHITKNGYFELRFPFNGENGASRITIDSSEFLSTMYNSIWDFWEYQQFLDIEQAR